jgi:ParB family transcriptional regulator, chromosome partitioning protein
MLERFVKGIIEKEGKKSVIEIPLDAISVNPYQPRRNFDEKKLDELAQSIREQGIIQPIIVRRLGAGYELVAGERRLRASRKLELKTIPAIVRQLDDQDMVEIAFIENLQREQLNEFEEAEAYGRLMQERAAMGPESIATRVGKDAELIKSKLWMLSLPPVVKKAVVSRLISLDHARLISQIANEKQQLEMLEKIYQEKLTVEQTRELIDRMPGMLRVKGPAMGTAAVASLASYTYSRHSLQQVDACLGLLRELILTFRRAGVRIEVSETFGAQSLQVRLTFPVDHQPA